MRKRSRVFNRSKNKNQSNLDDKRKGQGDFPLLEGIGFLTSSSHPRRVSSRGLTGKGVSKLVRGHGTIMLEQKEVRCGTGKGIDHEFCNASIIAGSQS